MSLYSLAMLTVFVFSALIPAFIAVLVARKQKRSKSIASLITFFIGLFTIAGGWVYVGILFLLPPKSTVSA